MTATVIPLLTPTQHRVLSAIRDHFTAHGYPPSIRELAASVGLSVSTVSYQLGRLQQMGWIRRHPNRSRSIVVLDPDTGAE